VVTGKLYLYYCIGKNRSQKTTLGYIVEREITSKFVVVNTPRKKENV